MPTYDELRLLQKLPLDMKIKRTQQRIREFVNHYGENGVYISFSGGKDSTVLLHIARQLYPNITAVFSDTGLELPSIRNFVMAQPNVTIIKPKLNFREVVLKYGYPLFSKEVSHSIFYARKLRDLSITPPHHGESKSVDFVGEFGEGKRRFSSIWFTRTGLTPPIYEIPKTATRKRKDFLTGKQKGTMLQFLTNRNICLLANNFPF